MERVGGMQEGGKRLMGPRKRKNRMAIRGMKVGGRRRNSIDGKETVIQ
jgi:hypothetical protein